MKKASSLLLIAALIVSLASCGGGAGDGAGQVAAPEDPSRRVSEIEAILGEELSGEITVSFFDLEGMLYERYLNEAAYLFEFDHPGTTVNVGQSRMLESDSFGTSDSPMQGVMESPEYVATLDYISRINTELMSGKGPDIIAIDVLPYYKYAASGYLEDLRLYMDADEDFDISDYRRDIIEAAEYNSGQYMLPTGFWFQFLTFDNTKVSAAAAAAMRGKIGFTYWEYMDMIHDQLIADDSGAMAIDFFRGRSMPCSES